MNIKNTYKTLFRKTFLVEKLPEPLSPSDNHLQIFDNYIEKTRIRLRKIRVPETKSWTRTFEQIFPFEEGNFSKLKISQMFLTETEYTTLELFKGREIRKNRYFLEFEDKQIEIDIFLGKLWGLNIAKIYFENEEELSNYILPDFSVFDVSNEEYFMEHILVDKSFSDIQAGLSYKNCSLNIA